MRALLFFLLLAFSFTTYSQVTVLDVGKNDVRLGSNMFYVVSGNPISNTKYVKLVEGSPYFSDVWMNGKLILGNDYMYDSIRLRLDLLENELQYIGLEGNELTATTPVKAITLIDSISGGQYHFINASFFEVPKTMEMGWYQLLIKGKASLYKKITKNITETKPYGSATVEQTIKTSNQFFIIVNDVFTRVKKLKDMVEVLADKKTELEKYTREKNLSGKSETDFSSVVSYYNKLAEGIDKPLPRSL